MNFFCPGASLPDSDFDSNKELEGQLFRLGMKFDEVHEHVDSNLKQQTTRRQPFQTSRLAEDQAAEDNDEVGVDVVIFLWGVGIAQWLECWSDDQKVVGLNCDRSSGRMIFSRVNFLCGLSFWYLFHPCVTAAARKRSWSFCQKCRWWVTATPPPPLHMWLHMN